MERDFEKDIIELDAAIKSNAERDNTFTLSVLQRVKAIMLQQKEKLKAYEDTGLTPGEVQYLKDKSEPRMVVWTPAYQSYYSAGDEAECLCPVCDSDVVEDDDYFCQTLIRKENQEMCKECIKKVLEWYSFGIIVGAGFYIGLNLAVQLLKVVTDVMRQWCL